MAFVAPESCRIKLGPDDLGRGFPVKDTILDILDTLISTQGWDVQPLCHLLWDKYPSLCKKLEGSIFHP